VGQNKSIPSVLVSFATQGGGGSGEWQSLNDTVVSQKEKRNESTKNMATLQCLQALDLGRN